jgi:N,N-dimethylformamidase
LFQVTRRWIMLIGYVSDERFVALADVQFEFVDRRGNSYEAHSRASGSVSVDLPPGQYIVTLQRQGYGSKRVRLQVPPPRVYQFRLLSDEIRGYAWPKWVRSGESSEFRVHCVEAFHVELWRHGWEKELFANLGWHDEHGPRAMMQITPDGDYSQTGVGWNQVGYGNTHQQRATAPSRSGLYYFHVRSRAGHRFSFPWIVAPARPTQPLAVLASHLTWNAYNSFGGRSNYILADELPQSPTVNARQDLKRYTDPEHQVWNCNSYQPLSFDRPEPINDLDLRENVTDPIEGRAACHVAPAEWRLLGWLEREGFAYDFYAETQLHDGTLDLSQYRVLILSVHPEYWTRTMYDRVKYWVFEEGGRLMYLGGNGLNCEVELLPNNAMICHNTRIRGLWPHQMEGAESRFARRHESEANLLGVVFTPAGIMTAAPYAVCDASHWVFFGTGLKNGDLFGLRSLHRRCPGGASGHETDKLSSSSPAQAHRLAKGMNPDDGGADMVIFETPSGGAVFSVGSICYPSSLLVDDGVSRITHNVLTRFLS